MDKLSQLSLQMTNSIPEDLSSNARRESESGDKKLNNGRKDSSPPVSPPKYSPEPSSANEDKEDRTPSPRKSDGSHQVNGSPRLPQAPVDLPVTSSAASFAAAVAALGGNPLSSGGPSPLMFPGFPGLLPPAGAFPGHLLGGPGGPPASSAAGSVLSQLALAGSHGFNPLGLPGMPGGPGAPGVRPMSK